VITSRARPVLIRPAVGQPAVARSGNLELLVAEVGDEFEGAAEGGDVAVPGVLGGDVAAFDLGNPGDGANASTVLPANSRAF